MSLDDKLKGVVIEELKQLNLQFIDYYSKRDKEVLNFLYNKEIIDDSLIETILEDLVFKQARGDYNIMVKRKNEYIIYADHIRRPDCFAYALDKYKFSKKEIKKIPFDHGDNVKIYIEEYGRNDLLTFLKKKLLDLK